MTQSDDMPRINHLNRPNPGILENAIRAYDAQDPRDISALLVCATLDKQIVTIPSSTAEGKPIVLNTGDFTWGSSHTGTGEPVFRGEEAGVMGTYLADHRQELLAAFTGTARCATRYAICARVLADLEGAFRLAADNQPKKAPRPATPFQGMPAIELMTFLSSPAVFKHAVARARTMLSAKPAWVTAQSPALKAWGYSRTNIEGVMDDICQVRDLVPVKDLGILREGEADSLIGAVEPERMADILIAVVDANPLPASINRAELERAIADFGVPADGRVAADQVQAQAMWMRGLMPSAVNYVPCQSCGFPVFFTAKVDEVAVKFEHGWQAGAVLGAGWKPGTDSKGTIPVAACICCRAEKILVEDGIKRFGRHPILLRNLGTTTVPREEMQRVWNLVWVRDPKKDIRDVLDAPQSDLAPGGAFHFGDVGDRLIGANMVPSMGYFRKRLSCAYRALHLAGHTVAFSLASEPHPCGVLGWVPPDQDDASVAHREMIHMLISRLPHRGYSRSDEKIDSLYTRERVIVAGSFDGAVCSLTDAMRSMDKSKRLVEAVEQIFALNGGVPMTLVQLNLLEEAAAWAEVAFPYLNGKQDIYFKEGAPTKAFSEAIKAMQQAAPEARVGAAMAAFTRNHSEYLTKEEKEQIADVSAAFQVRFERYAKLNQAELQKFHNALLPMVKAAVNYGVSYVPGQNNFCKRLRRRLLDAEGVEVTTVDEVPAEPQADADVTV